MSKPVYVGMPPTDRRFDVPRTGTPDPNDSWGEIRCGGPCTDDYGRINVHVQDAQHFLKLQQAAINSIKVVEERLGYSVLTTGSWRSCATATELYRQDPQRFAPPNAGAHMRGLAIDVNQNLSQKKRKEIHDMLLSHGWHQARSDEPWHYSFGIEV